MKFLTEDYLDRRKPETANQEPLTPEWPFILGLILLGLVLFFYRLGGPGLMDPDEGRYAEIAREILVRQDWLVPHLNFFPYLEKPPLVYWLTALSFKGLGLTETAARLPAAFSALAGMLLAYGLGRALWGPGPGVASAVVLASSVGYVILGRILTLDMTFTFFLNLAIGLGYLALSRGRRELWSWAYAALALAVLTKGPVAVVLCGLIWGIWILLSRRSWWELVRPGGWIILAALTLPWFVSVELRHPDFFRFYVLEQHLGRFLTPAIHPEPFYYYGPVILGFMLPWTWLLPWALIESRLSNRDWPFLVVWAAVILVFFSLSQGKLAPYILPAALPLALLMGSSLYGILYPGAQVFNTAGLKAALLAWALVGIVAVALCLWPPALMAQALSRINLSPVYLVTVSLIFVLTPIAALLWRPVGTLLLGALLLSALLPLGIDRVSLARSPREMSLVLKSEWQPGAALVGVQLYSQGMSFYSRQIFHLLGCRTELDFGQTLAPNNGLCLADEADLPAFVAGRPRTFFLLKDHYLSALEQELPGKFHLLAAQKDCILVAYEGK